MRTATLTNEKTQTGAEKMAAAHEQMLEQLGELVTSDDWRRVLDIAATMHSYSPRNRLWLAIQAAERNMPLSLVFGYRAWQQHGRQVLKGERGLLVLCPIVSRIKPEADDDSDKVREILRTFRLGYVFDVSQTDGDEIPDTKPERLAGLAPEGLIDALHAQCEAQGYRVHCAELDPGANGQTDFLARTVTIAPGLSSAQAGKTLAHELAHVLLHDPAGEVRASRAVCEVEAESVAYLVCRSLELPSESYSLPYVGHWSGGDSDLVASTAERAIATAARIVEAIDEREVVPA